MKLKILFIGLFTLTGTSNASTQTISLLNEKIVTQVQPLVMRVSSPIHPSSSMDVFAHMGIDLYSLPRVDSPSTKDVGGIEEKTSTDSVHQEAQSPKYLEVIKEGKEVSVLRFKYEKKRGYLAYKDGTPLKAFVSQLNQFHTENPDQDIAIDLSQHLISINTGGALYKELTDRVKGKIKCFNLSGTSIGCDITDVLEELIKKDSFKYLEIIGTTAAEDAETFSPLDPVLKSKIIYIPQKYLQEEEVVKHHSGHIKTHEDYFKEDIFGK